MSRMIHTTISEKVYRFLAAAFAVFLLGFLVCRPAIVPALWPGNEESGQVYWLLLIWLAVASLYSFLLSRLEHRCSVMLFSFVLFLLCALPRLAVLQFQYYIPTNDFANYLLYGQCFVQGDYAPAADLIANYYQMPKMGGIVVFNGLLMLLFGDMLLGMQMANIALTGGICVILYHLIRPIHGQAAWITALLWMLYPSNIISTQIPTNHHGATLFFLLGLLLYSYLLRQKQWSRIVLLAIATGICLAISNFIHPSVIVIQLSILCFTLLTVVQYACRERKLLGVPAQKLLAACLLIFITGAGCQQIGLQQLQQHQVITDRQEISVLFKLVLGFNQDSNGSFSEIDYNQIRQLPQEQQAEACLTLLQQRLQDPLSAALFMLQKTDTAWFQRDGYFYWYREGALLEYSQQEQNGTLTEEQKQQYWQAVDWIQGAQTLDIIFVRVVYWLAVIGLLCGSFFKGDIENVLFFVPLGWIAVIMLTEMQSRYRYPAMPAFFLLAALGVCTLWQWSRKKEPRHGKVEKRLVK